jgi:hypothetical protein
MQHGSIDWMNLLDFYYYFGLNSRLKKYAESLY